jgi:hypothetical protein
MSTFESEEEFKEFLRLNNLYRETPEKDIRITSMKQAVAASKISYSRLFIRTPLDEREKSVSVLRGFVKSEAMALEVTTTLALANNELLREMFGPLKLVNNGKGVVFKQKNTGDTFGVGGLVKNSVVLLLNEVKSHLHDLDVAASSRRRRCSRRRSRIPKTRRRFLLASSRTLLAFASSQSRAPTAVRRALRRSARQKASTCLSRMVLAMQFLSTRSWCSPGELSASCFLSVVQRFDSTQLNIFEWR